jgi:hypothetical protein
MSPTATATRDRLGNNKRQDSMATISEIDALKAVDETLSAVEDTTARDRVLRWAWEKFSTRPIPKAPQEEEEESGTAPPKSKQKTGAQSAKAKPKGKAKLSPSIVKDLNLKPSGKKSLDAFSSEKKPSSNQQKCAVSVYYLRNELALDEVGADHIYTCFKHMKWRVPSDLRNTLQYTASKDGWLDTADMSDIKMTAIGDNLVEHDLPSPEKSKK